LTSICREWGQNFPSHCHVPCVILLLWKNFFDDPGKSHCLFFKSTLSNKCNNESLNYSKILKFVFITLYACSFAINLTNHALILAQAYLATIIIFFSKIKFASSHLYSGRLKSFCFRVSRASGWDIVPTQVMQAFVWFAFVELYD